MPREVEGLVDDPSVHNPLQRMERLGTGWFGVIMEVEGVLFQDTWEAHSEVRALLLAASQAAWGQLGLALTSTTKGCARWQVPLLSPWPR